MNEPIQEKAPKPPGLLPKHVQSWLILGLAVLMIVIMWLTGGKKQQTAAKANASVQQTPLPVEVNETKIADLSESNPGTPATATCCAECPRSTESLTCYGNPRPATSAI